MLDLVWDSASQMLTNVRAINFADLMTLLRVCSSH